MLQSLAEWFQLFQLWSLLLLWLRVRVGPLRDRDPRLFRPLLLLIKLQV